MMRSVNRGVAVFLLISLLALPVTANAWIEVNLRSNAGQNVPGDPDVPLNSTIDNGHSFTASFEGESPNLLFVTLLESAIMAVLQTPCAGL